uniref:Uncharacterized protein n=1 Tax=Rhizophora mucronata TaxID=61149 RepID=A0A2P2JGE5_RHIMU
MLCCHISSIDPIVPPTATRNLPLSFESAPPLHRRAALYQSDKSWR